MRLVIALQVVLALVLAGAVAGSHAVTNSLAELELGLQENVGAARALLATQQSIRERNAVLGEVVMVTGRIRRELDGVLVRSRGIESELDAIAAANAAILGLNQALRQDNRHATESLARVPVALRGMRAAASGIRDQMAELRDVLSGDRDVLRAIGANTARMNARTPGGFDP